MMVLSRQSNHFQYSVCGSTQLNRLMAKSMPLPKKISVTS